MPLSPVHVSSQRPLVPNVTSVTSVANDMVIMKCSREPCTNLLAFSLQLRKKPGKPQLGDSLMKELCDQSSPQMGSLTSKWGQKGNTARQEGRRKERGKGPGWDWVILILPRAISPVYTFISIILETTLFIQIQVRSLNRTKGWDILDIYDFYNPTCTSSVYCFLAEHDDVAVTSNQQKTRQFIQPINYSSVAHISNKTENHGPTNTSCRFMTIDSSVNMRYCNFHNITSFDSRCSYI